MVIIPIDCHTCRWTRFCALNLRLCLAHCVTGHCGGDGGPHDLLVLTPLARRLIDLARGGCACQPAASEGECLDPHGGHARHFLRGWAFTSPCPVHPAALNGTSTQRPLHLPAKCPLPSTDRDVNGPGSPFSYGGLGKHGNRGGVSRPGRGRSSSGSPPSGGLSAL